MSKKIVVLGPVPPPLGGVSVHTIRFIEVLKATGWHKGQACEILGVSRPRLRRMIREHGLSPSQELAPREREEDVE